MQHAVPGDPSADFIPDQIKAMAVPVSVGGPSWGHSFSEVFWNVAEESEVPHCSFWGLCRLLSNNCGNPEVPSPI